jgi:GTPase
MHSLFFCSKLLASLSLFAFFFCVLWFVLKSSLLRAISKARPKVANYPFTTLVPNLGVCEAVDRFNLGHSMARVWLDIPGLIEGASEGKGLGLAFLRHAERCRVLLHLVDGESPHPGADLSAINAELEGFSTALARTPQAVVLTKTDLPHVRAGLPRKLAELRAAAGHLRVLSISSLDGTNVRDLVIRTNGMLVGVEKRAGDGTRTQESS